MIKIAFIGTHGTRKTTYAHDLTAYLKTEGINADMLNEVARECPPVINEERTSQAQEWILYSQIAGELGFLKSSLDVLVCDRSVVDDYAYYVERFGNEQVLDMVVKRQIPTYDTLFRTKIPSGEIVADGVRSTEKDFQKSIDETLTTLLQKFDVPYIDLEDINQVKEYALGRVQRVRSL